LVAIRRHPRHSRSSSRFAYECRSIPRLGYLDPVTGAERARLVVNSDGQTDVVEYLPAKPPGQHPPCGTIASVPEVGYRSQHQFVAIDHRRERHDHGLASSAAEHPDGGHRVSEMLQDRTSEHDIECTIDVAQLANWLIGMIIYPPFCR
jgi:hypothetical protein